MRRTELLNHGRDGEIELIAKPLPMHRNGIGLASYGAKIPTQWVVHYAGRMRRVYCTCYSNAGTCWFTVEGRKMIVG